MELDWDAYLAVPDQADRAYHLRAKAQTRKIAEDVPPEVQGQAEQAALMLARGVVQGTYTRETFDEQVEGLRELGYLTDDAHRAALAIIDG